MLYANNDTLTMQFGFNGLRWTDINGTAVANRLMQTVVGTKGINPDFKPMWLPFYNYTPIYTPTFTEQNIMQTGETKWTYAIDPTADNGICLINEPPFNDNNAPQEGWILLPPRYFTDADGDNVQLPLGYTVVILNTTYMMSSAENRKTMYVTGNVQQANACKIYGHTGNSLTQYALMGGSTLQQQNNEVSTTFVYVGTQTINNIPTMLWQVY